MKFTKKNQMAFIVSLAMVVGGCATSQYSKLEPKDSHDAAILKGHNSSFFKEIFLPLGTNINLKIKSVDGHTTWNAWSGYASEVKLSEGPHRVDVLCYGELDGSVPFQQSFPIEIDVKSGSVYKLTPNPEGRRCDILIENISEKSNG